MEVKTQSPVIVLIEKDEVTLDLYRRELSKSFTVLAYGETVGVLEAMADQNVQAVIIEPVTQYEQGREFIHSIYTTFPTQFIPVIICSTRDPDDFDLAGEVTKYLTKPVLPNKLRDQVLEILARNEERLRTL
jgi:DNA-binding response OmpR family regulator